MRQFLSLQECKSVCEGRLTLLPTNIHTACVTYVRVIYSVAL